MTNLGFRPPAPHTCSCTIDASPRTLCEAPRSGGPTLSSQAIKADWTLVGSVDSPLMAAPPTGSVSGAGGLLYLSV